MSGETSQRPRIVVFGLMFWYPLAGITYQFLHYLIGLRKLGYDVYYVEDSSRWIYDPERNEISPDATRNLQSVAPILEAHGFAGRWAYRQLPDRACHGLSERELLQLYRDADAFLNVTGSQELREEHLTCPRRIYVETDPFATQVHAAKGDKNTLGVLAAHHHHFTFGENIGAPDCDVPALTHRWLPTRQPVALELWSRSPLAAAGKAYNTITTWFNKGKDIEYRGDTYYWTKGREFERFLSLPRHRPVRLELATSVQESLAERLRDHGFRCVDSVAISRDMQRYRSFIQGARAEFTVARDQYVRPRTGWFSDRSACYLAAGRPVITQDTGFGKFLPVGKGLFAFRTMDDVLGAIDAIESDYAAHCKAAQELAAEYFAAEKVLGSLLQRAGL